MVTLASELRSRPSLAAGAVRECHCENVMRYRYVPIHKVPLIQEF